MQGIKEIGSYKAPDSVGFTDAYNHRLVAAMQATLWVDSSPLNLVRFRMRLDKREYRE